MNKIKIKFSGIIVEAELNDTETAKKISSALPIKGRINRWGDEIYFTAPIEGILENGIEVMEVGDLAFWPPGNAFCIFFGPTPASTGKEPRAAGPVTKIGKILNKEDLKVLRSAPDGNKIILT